MESESQHIWASLNIAQALAFHCWAAAVIEETAAFCGMSKFGCMPDNFCMHHLSLLGVNERADENQAMRDQDGAQVALPKVRLRTATRSR